MKILFHSWRWLLTLLLALCSLLPAAATHIRGGEITYTRIASTTAGVPRYHVLVTLYCNPASSVKQETVDLTVLQGSCASGNVVTISIPKSASIAASPNVACSPDSQYLRYTYDTDLDLPAGRWLLGASLENRVDNVLNINGGNSVNQTLYISTYLDNTLTDQDSSPRFESQVLPLLDASGISPNSFTTYDPDADSLVYTNVLPSGVLRTTSGQASGCGIANTNSIFQPNFQLDRASGALVPVAGTQPQGFYAMAVRVDEYRRLNGQWQLLGYVVRDLTYVTFAPGTPANHAPAYTALQVNGAAQPLSQPIVARPGQLLRLGLTATDPDAGQQLRFSSNAPNVVPGLGLASPAAGQAQVQWQVPATLPPGRYQLAFDVFDDGCPHNLNTTATLTVVVTNQALAARTSLNAEHEVYPVPFREQVRFRAAPGQAVTLLDALGRTVAQLQAGPDGQVLWQPSEAVRPGLYVARAADGQALARLLRE